LIADKKLAEPVVHAHAGDVFGGAVTEHTLERAIDSVPDLDATGMGCNEGVENRVVKHAAASLVISQMVIGRLIIVVELHAPASSNDSLRRLCYCETVDFIQGAVEGLHGRESTDIPDPEHSRNISRDDLVGALHPLDAD